jgi:hypothetical protein
MYHARSAHKVRAYRPCVEVLEARNLLSTYLVNRLIDIRLRRLTRAVCTLHLFLE